MNECPSCHEHLTRNDVHEARDGDGHFDNYIKCPKCGHEEWILYDDDMPDYHDDGKKRCLNCGDIIEDGNDSNFCDELCWYAWQECQPEKDEGEGEEE